MSRGDPVRTAHPRVIARALIVLLTVAGVIAPGAVAIGLSSLTASGVEHNGVILTGPTTTLNATFDAAPDPSKVVFSLSNGTRKLELSASSCDGDTCSVPGVPVEWSPKRAIQVWVSYGTTSFYVPGAITIRPDVTPPTIESVSFGFSDPSTITFKAADPSGIARWKLLRDGTRIANGTSDQETLSDTVTLTDALVSGQQADFVLSVTDPFGNTAARTFGGTVDTSPPTIGSIEQDATIAGAIGYVSFTVSGDHIDPGSVSITIGGTRHPASCTGTVDPSCMASVENPPRSTPVQATVSAADTFGSTTTKQAMITFTPDTTAPEFRRIGSDYAGYNASRSYSGGSFFIEFNESGAMDPSETIARITPDGSSPYRITADRCSPLVNGLVKCYFSLDKTAKVSYWSASDRAGNEATVPSRSLTTRSIAFDRTAPQVRVLVISADGRNTASENIALAAPGTITVRTIVTAEGSRITKAKITERVPGSDPVSKTVAMSCTLMSSNNQEAQCVSGPIGIQQSEGLTIDLYDASGFPYEAKKTITIGGTSAPGASGWQPTSVTAHPNMFLPDGSMPITLDIELQAVGGGSAVSLAGASVTSCNGIDAPLASTDGSTLSITGFSNGKDLGSNGKGSCTVELTTGRNGAIDTHAQDLVVNFTLTSINAAGLESVSAYNKTVADQQLALHSVLSVAQQVQNYADIACTAYKTTNDASKAINTVAVALGGDASVVNPIGAVAASVGGTVFSTVKSIRPYADPLCGVFQCAIPLGNGKTLQQEVMSIYSPIEGNLASDINSIAPFSIASQESTTQRVESSLILSGLTMCVPGIIDNVKKLNEIGCGQQLCLLEVQNGDFKGSASLCSYAHSMQICGYIGDQVFAIVPFGPMAEQLLGNVGTSIQEPFSIAAGWAADLLAQAFPSVRLLLSTNLQNLFSDLAHMAGIGQGSPTNQPQLNYCQQLQDYRTSHPSGGGSS